MFEPAAATTVAGALLAGATRLRKGLVPHARREAAQIWSALQDMAPWAPWLDRSAPVPEDALTAYRAAVARRATGVPLAYAVGRVAFRHLTLTVDERVLIPRPETEGLVDRVLRWGVERPGAHLLEIGVGSGAVILSLAVEGNFERLVGTEISAAALDVARINLRAVAPDSPVDLRCGDMFAPVRGEKGRGARAGGFDVVVANPPYIAPAEYAVLDPSVRSYEPRHALESGAGGMEHITVLCREATGHLTPGGLLALEIDARRASEAVAVARRAGLRKVRVERDLFGRDRYLLAHSP